MSLLSRSYKFYNFWVNLFSVDKENVQKLREAILKNDVAEVEELLKYGADIEYNEDGKTSLMLAVEEFRPIEITEMLLECGAQLDHKVYNDLTPLHIAVSKNSIPLTSTLLQWGADANLVDAEGNSPLHVAAENGNQPISGLLLRYGADPTILNHQEYSPVDIAKLHGHGTLGKFLEYCQDYGYKRSLEYMNFDDSEGMECCIPQLDEFYVTA